MGPEIVIPSMLFICLTLAIVLPIFFRYRFRTEVQTTVRSAIEKGQELTPEILERLGESKKPKNADLRKGIMSLMVAIGIATFGYFVDIDDEDVGNVFLAIACIPAFVGIAYMVLWKLDDNKDD
jgi:drug/metabolite transporter (DMT)-like permease